MVPYMVPNQPTRVSDVLGRKWTCKEAVQHLEPDALCVKREGRFFVFESGIHEFMGTGMAIGESESPVGAWTRALEHLIPVWVQREVFRMLHGERLGATLQEGVK